MELHTDIVTCKQQDTITEVAKIIRDRRVRHVYVLEKGILTGVIAGMDINNKIVAEAKDARKMVAENIMNKVMAVREAQVEKAYAVMRNFNTFICPVTDTQGKLIGYYKFAEICETLHRSLVN
jgi:predicted transcriptional regulator